MKKKLFALFMILALLVCLLPAAALAAPSVNLERLADFTEQEDPAEEAEARGFLPGRQ